LIAMSEERPTPAPMADDEDDCMTEVWRGQLAPAPPPTAEPPAPQSGVVIAPPSNPPESIVIERPSIADARRDTIVDPPPSLWQRFKAGVADFVETAKRDFLGVEPPLTRHLPPVPPLRRREATLVSPGVTQEDEHGERMLLALAIAAPRYQRAAVRVARRALAMHREGGKAYMEFLVHFALSRLRPDENDRIAITRLRDVLPSIAFAGELVPALIRLEEQGAVLLVVDTSDGDPMTALLRQKITHIELREPV